MKKYLGLILDCVAFVLAGCCFLTMIMPAVTLSVTIGQKTTSTINAYDLIGNGGVLYIVALVLLCVGLALIACDFVLGALKIKFSYKKVVGVLAGVVLVAGGILFFLSVPCFNMLGDSDVNNIINSLGSLVNYTKGIGVGAIFSGILAIVSACVICYKSLKA